MGNNAQHIQSVLEQSFFKNILKIAILTSMFVLTGCGGGGDGDEPAEITSTTLNGVEISNFMYQIQNLEERSKVDELANTQYDMLVVEPGFNIQDEPYEADYIVEKLNKKPNGDKRLVLAYIDIGQAEEWRTYWEDNWKAPTANTPGFPSFIVTRDPDGWEGNYPVAYWDEDWKNIWLSSGGLIEQIASLGFDGVYLDWVEAYDDDDVRAAAQNDNVNPENEMMKFITEIRNTGKAIKSDFLVVAQNAPYLIDVNPDEYVQIIDAIATEDTWFYGDGGDAGDDWESALGGDLKGGERHGEGFTTDDRVTQNKKYLDLGIPVFTVDYCLNEENAEYVYNESRRNGFIPLVTRVSLFEITETPPF